MSKECLEKITFEETKGQGRKSGMVQGTFGQQTYGSKNGYRVQPIYKKVNVRWHNVSFNRNTMVSHLLL